MPAEWVFKIPLNPPLKKGDFLDSEDFPTFARA